MRSHLWLAVAVLALVAPVVRACPEDDLVMSWYHRYLGRCASPQEVQSWAQQIRCGTPIEELEAAFLGCPEYYQRCGNCPDGFVSRLYLDVLGRPACEREIRQWAHQLRHCNRMKLACNFLRGAQAELAQRAAPPVVVQPQPVVIPQPVAVAPVQVLPSYTGNYRGPVVVPTAPAYPIHSHHHGYSNYPPRTFPGSSLRVVVVGR